LNFKGIVAVAALAGLTATQVGAAPVPYVCEYTSHSRTGWIPEKALYVIDADAGTAQVYDGYVKHLHDDLIDAAFHQIRAGKYRVKYTLVGLPTSNSSSVTVTYTVRLDVGAGRSTLDAVLHASDNRPHGSGKCKPYTG
jgi:hypothetical protein